MEQSADGAASPALPSLAGTATPLSVHNKMPSTDGLHNKLLDQVIRTPDRMPSPQPTHLSVPGSTGQRKLQPEEGSGYVAPKFEGKEQQMEAGEHIFQSLGST